MKNIVFLLGSYYPNYSAVGRCQGNLADEFEKRGYNITVISQKTYSSEPEKELLGKQRIIRVETKDMIRDMVCREQIKKGNRRYLLKHKFNQLKRVLKIVFAPNSLDNLLVKSYVDALRQLEHKPDLIIPTCLPFETVKAAIEYKKLELSCKVVPILYDMFSQSRTIHRFEWNKRIKEKTNLFLEREMLENSEKVLHMPVWSGVLKRHFNDLLCKTREIEHPLILKHSDVFKIQFSTDNIDIVYTGVVDNKMRNPQGVLNFFDDVIFNEVKVHFYSLGSAQNKVDEVAKSSDVIISHGQVSNEIAQAAVYSSDVLLSIGNNSNIQMPSKIFEYMSVGKPIIHFSQVKDDLVCNVLNKYPLAFVIPSEITDITKLRNEVKNFINTNNARKLSFEIVRDLFPEADVKNIVDSITKDFLDGGGI